MSLRIFLFLLGLCVAAYCSEKSGYNGQPGCKSAEEMKVKFYRNFWDPTKYWECTIQGVPGVERRCYDGTAFFANLGECVDWYEWRWDEEKMPPSFPWDLMAPAESTDAMNVRPQYIQYQNV